MIKDNLKSEIYNLTNELIETEQAVRIKVQGVSMFPFLHTGDIVTLKKIDIKYLKKGDIIGFKHNEKWVVHRLIRKKNINGKEYIITKGDTCKSYDPEITENNYLGKIISFTRAGKNHNIVSLYYNMLNYIIASNTKLFSFIFIMLLNVIDKIRSFKNYSKEISKKIGFICKSSKKLAAINIIISVLQGVFPYIIIYLIKLTVDRITYINTISDKTMAFKSILLLICVTGSFFLISSVINLISGFYRERFSHYVSMYIYNLLHNKYCSLDMAYLESSDNLDKIHRAINESTYRPFKLITEGFTIVQSLIAMVVIVFMLLHIHWIVFILIIIAVFPEFLIRIKYATILYKFNKENSTKEREAFYYSRILTGIPFAKEIRLFGFKSFFQNRFNAIKENIFNNKDKILKHHLKYEIISQIFAITLIFGSFAFVTYQSIQGKLSVGTVVLFFLIFQRGFALFKDLFQNVAGLYEDNIYLNDFFDFLNFPSLKNIDTSTNRKVSLNKGIFVDNITFRYPASSRYALKNVSLTIPKGKVAALVGVNGSGKTTLVKLLCKFYNPDNGHIFFDDIDISETDENEVRKLITVVFQDFALYNISASDNIALGDISKRKDYELIKIAAKNSGISDVLENLPFSYDNILGNLFEKGEELSIGQWQKIAIARAFYRNSPILLMDEPSSALDAETELSILANLKNLAQDKTVLIISHRLSAIKWADIIYVIDDGQIIESGTHDELMQKKGKYYNLFIISNKS